MLWFVLTTGACNLRCRYCGGGFPPEHSPPRPRYSVERLAKLIAGADSRPVVFFYGGEPLVNPEPIMRLMDLLGGRAVYGIQTNGTLYRRLPPSYWERFTTVLLSIDGREGLTDYWRGRGVYRRVVEALRFLQRLRRERGGPRTIIARMVGTRYSNIYLEVMHLLRGLGFDKAHWQLDAVWSEEWNIAGWAWESYLPGLHRLARWVAAKPWERLRRVVPFHGIVSALLVEPHRWVPCGAGRGAVAVNTDGRILACPIAVRERWATIGSVEKGFKPMPEDVLRGCMGCPYYQLCGGRCLYAQLEKYYWSPSRLRDLDTVTKRTIDIVLREVVPAVERAIEKGLMDGRSIHYDPLLESTEVIP